jgi:hypothetical protein
MDGFTSRLTVSRLTSDITHGRFFTSHFQYYTWTVSRLTSDITHGRFHFSQDSLAKKKKAHLTKQEDEFEEWQRGQKRELERLKRNIEEEHERGITALLIVDCCCLFLLPPSKPFTSDFDFRF